MKTVLTLITLFLTYIVANGQKVFSEGTIKYDVYQNNETKPSGIYHISVKSGNIRRELVMNNGFSNITLFQFKSGKSYSLNLEHENKYALEMLPEELKAKNKKFEAAVITPKENIKKLCGYNAQEASVNYQDGNQISIYYTKDLIPQGEAFNAMFPGLQGIALEYEVIGNSGVKMRFVASMLSIKVIDSQIFEVPADYKLVSKEELQKLR